MNKFTVNYKEIENLINNTYGIKFSLIADQEMQNDSFRTFDVEKYGYEDFNLKRDIDSRKTYNANLYMQDLCEKGLIEDGEYTVLVSW